MADEQLSSNFSDLILNRTEAWQINYDETNRAKLRETVTMEKRFRGDNFGTMHSNPLNLDWISIQGRGLFSYPVVFRAVRAKQSQCLSTDIRLEWEANRKTPELEAGAELMQAVFNYGLATYFTEPLRAALGLLPQTGRCCYTLTRRTANGGVIYKRPVYAAQMQTVSHDEFQCLDCQGKFRVESDVQSGLAADAVPSGDDLLNTPAVAPDLSEQEAIEADYQDIPASDADSGSADVSTDKENASSPIPQLGTRAGQSTENLQPVETQAIQDVEQPITGEQHLSDEVCPFCQSPRVSQISEFSEQEKELPTGEFEEFDSGGFTVDVIPSILTRIDEYNAIGFNLPRAHWFNYHPLVNTYEIESRFPHLKGRTVSGFQSWSDASRWHYELSKHSGNYGNSVAWQSRLGADELGELDHWWISPVACGEWRSPDYFELSDADGEYFNIEPGETIKEAFVRLDLEKGGKGVFKGCLVLIHNDQIAMVYNEHHTEAVTGFGWFINPSSYYPDGEERLLKLQDTATNIFTMYYDHVKRTSNPKLIGDPFFFNEADLKASVPGQIIFYKQEVPPSVAQGRTPERGAWYLEAPQLGADAYRFMEVLQMIIKEESGIYDETVGSTDDGNKTLGGRKLAIDRSLGLMLAPIKAFKHGLIEWGYLFAEQFQQMPDEAFALIKGTFNEEWKQFDIKAFRALDIRRDLKCAALPGSDIPKSMPEMEQKFVAVMQLGLLDPANPLPLQVRATLIKKVFGIDYDLENYAADLRLAEIRFKLLKQITKQQQELVANQYPDLVNSPVLEALVSEQVAELAKQNGTLRIRQTDKHLIFAEYYTDQLKSLCASEKPDNCLISALELQIAAHRTVETINAAQTNSLIGMAEAAGAAGAGLGQQVLQPEANAAALTSGDAPPK